MAAKLIQPPIPSPHVSPRMMMKSHRQISTTHSTTTKTSVFSKYPVWLRPISTIRVVEQSSDNLIEEEDPEDFKSLNQIKSNLFQALQGINRGIFGVTSSKKSEIEDLVKFLEAENPTVDPTMNLDKNIDVAEGKAFNVIKFNARGLNLLNGKLTIEASFDIATKSRVNIKYDNSTITPEQLMNMFRKNYDLLLGIFNPEGWLEITYVDDTMRIGRDDKGNVFILVRLEE